MPKDKKLEKEIEETLNEWEEVDPRADEVHDFQTEKVLVGIYVSRQNEVGPNASTLYHIQKDDGTKVGVWGNGVLNDRFSMIEIGNKVKIEYLGKETSDKTGRQYHNYKVYHKPVFQEV